MKGRRKTILDIRLRKLIESMRLSELSEVKTKRGALNPFVSGLLLSSSLMDEVRQEVPYNMHVAWGQALNENDVLSGELDIILYLGKPLYQWKSIGYAIVPKQQICSIIEVKRKFYTYKDHKYELNCLKNYHDKVLLVIFETYNTIKGIKERENKLRKLGYTDVFYLVRLTEGEGKEVPQPLYEDWYRFMDTVAEIQ